MNSQPQYSRGGSSPMPLILTVLFFVCVIIGLLVYHFMFYKPSLEVCSNLYASNICTTDYCVAENLCPPESPPEWNPKIDANSGSLLGYKVTLPTTGKVATLYNTEITSLESAFDSNVCDTLKTMDLSSYHPALPDDAPADTEPDTEKINCIELLNKIDDDLQNTPLSWIEESKLLEARNAVIDLCAPASTATSSKGQRVAIDAASSFPTSAINTKTGEIAKLFCTQPSST